MEKPAKLNFKTIQPTLKHLPTDISAPVFDYLKANTPQRFKDITFSGINKKYQADVESIIDALFSDQPKGLFLTGDVGTGKTSILRVIWRYAVAGIACRDYQRILTKCDDDYERERQLSVFRDDSIKLISQKCEFVSNWQLVRDLRKHVEAEFSQAAHYTPHTLSGFLFLDDLGRGYEDASGWNLALQDEFFDARWQTTNPIFVSTNKSKTQLRDWKGWSRIVDRLADASCMIMINMGDSISRRKG